MAADKKLSKTNVTARAARRKQAVVMGVCGHAVRPAKIVMFPHARGRMAWFCDVCNDVVSRAP